MIVTIRETNGNYVVYFNFYKPVGTLINIIYDEIKLESRTTKYDKNGSIYFAPSVKRNNIKSNKNTYHDNNN